MTYKTLEQLYNVLKVWFEDDIPNRRLQLDMGQGRKWYIDALKWTDNLTLEKLRTLTDREELNKDYDGRWRAIRPQLRTGLAAIKMEISQLFGFNRVVIQRHKTRLQFYRDDLSQKGARNMYNLWQSFAMFKWWKNIMDVPG